MLVLYSFTESEGLQNGLDTPQDGCHCQNAITDLNPVNIPLENLFLVFILSYTLFIPLKQINPHKKSKTKQKIKAKKNPKTMKTN